MIELLLADRCTACGDCVAVCPSNVFEATQGGMPVIARPLDCQTCFMCELYCPADALYVDPDCEAAHAPDAERIRQSGLLGRFRRLSGWGDEPQAHPNLHWRMESVFQRARDG